MMKQLKSTGRELTKAEEQIMHIFWDKGSALVHDILKEFPEPKPAYNTVSTIIRILEQKGFIGHKAYGRTYEYYPLISKNDYTRTYFRSFVANYFGNSYKSLASFFASEEKISIEELEEIRRLMDMEIQKQKAQKK
ncbi:MAG TPA: BlaI/MecI/CopY family transcriptional regulator [Bacteroidales bacterium]|nr:BlaI/MecI/CopY family transcriptional regulator [Bacteroidales bacterium]